MPVIVREGFDLRSWPELPQLLALPSPVLPSQFDDFSPVVSSGSDEKIHGVDEDSRHSVASLTLHFTCIVDAITLTAAFLGPS